MASEVDICNLALANIGDSAQVTSISPPDGSMQAAHCSRFYPMARNALLEMYDWTFATTRTSLALIANLSTPQWTYVYAAPADCLNTIAVLDPNATDDTSILVPQATYGYNIGSVSQYVPQPYVNESMTDSSGNIYNCILTDQANAELRYLRVMTDSTKFSNLFVRALSWLLAADLAGVIIKGDVGLKTSQEALKAFGLWKKMAVESDAAQHMTRPAQSVPWMANR